MKVDLLPSLWQIAAHKKTKSILPLWKVNKSFYFKNSNSLTIRGGGVLLCCAADDDIMLRPDLQPRAVVQFSPEGEDSVSAAPRINSLDYIYMKGLKDTFGDFMEITFVPFCSVTVILSHI